MTENVGILIKFIWLCRSRNVTLVTLCVLCMLYCIVECIHLADRTNSQSAHHFRFYIFAGITCFSYLLPLATYKTLLFLSLVPLVIFHIFFSYAFMFLEICSEFSSLFTPFVIRFLFSQSPFSLKFR